MQLLSPRRRRLATAAASLILVGVPVVSSVAAHAADTATGHINTSGAPLKVLLLGRWQLHRSHHRNLLQHQWDRRPQHRGLRLLGLHGVRVPRGAGLRLSSTSRSQYADGPRVAISELKAGDMIFWSNSSRTASGIHHVALYIGAGRIAEANRVSGPDVRVRSFSTRESGVMPFVVRPIR